MPIMRKTKLKEEIKMAGWELALVIVAVTFMVVNVVTLLMQVALMANYRNLFVKGAKMMEKMLDKSDKVIDDLFGDDEDLKL